MAYTAEDVLGALKDLVARSGDHQPSPASLQRVLPNLAVRVDACFLTNPYATELFVGRFLQDTSDTRCLQAIVADYPADEPEIAERISRYVRVPSDCLLAGNGGAELIRKVLFDLGPPEPIVVPVPTFSQYYCAIDGAITHYRLVPEDDFALNIEELLSVVEDAGARTAVLVNPNNPTGALLQPAAIRAVADATAGRLDRLIVDESFLPFAPCPMASASSLVETHPHVVVIASMSKDFGVPGLRLGYAVMSPARVGRLRQTTPVWNLNGLADYFASLLSDPSYLDAHTEAMSLYREVTASFFADLAHLPNLRMHPSCANFALLRLPSGLSGRDAVARLLAERGVYVRDCSAKFGLSGEYVRVAARTAAENELTIEALSSLVAAC